MYTAVYKLKTIDKFPTFKEAFKAIYDAIKADKEPLTYQALETTIWIGNGGFCMYFYEARDMMCMEGHLVGGKWID